MEVRTSQFEFSHGKAPRGEGNWAFLIGRETKWFYGNYGDAKKEAIAYAKTKRLDRIEVLP